MTLKFKGKDLKLVLNVNLTRKVGSGVWDNCRSDKSIGLDLIQSSH